jgi:hypothetical protein
MKYAVEMDSVAMIHLQSFIKFSPGIQQLMRGDSQTHRRDGDRISLIYEIRLKRLLLQNGRYEDRLLREHLQSI